MSNIIPPKVFLKRIAILSVILLFMSLLGYYLEETVIFYGFLFPFILICFWGLYTYFFHKNKSNIASILKAHKNKLYVIIGILGSISCFILFIFFDNSDYMFELLGLFALSVSMMVKGFHDIYY
ncbi:MAG: hypothetical protein ACMXX6_01495 [Candidatus Woesearchaeota archaeon]